MISYKNPYPVAVLLLPVWATDDPSETRRGILIGQRGHHPGFGEYGLPGGFVELGENFEAGCLRELREETGLEVEDDYVRITHSRPATNGTQVLVFSECLHTVTPSFVQKQWVPSSECPAVAVVYNPVPLAFPTHTEALKLWFERNSI